MKKSLKNQITFGNMLSVIAIIVSVIAIVFTNNLTKKVNSKEFQMSENLKYELLKMVADLKSIESKASIQHLMPEEMDYSKEMEDISNFRTSPGYLIYLNSLPNDDDRLMFDLSLLLLTSSKNTISTEDVRALTHNTLEKMKNETNLKKSLNKEVSVLIAELCEMRIVAPQYEHKKPDDDGVLAGFLKYLLIEKRIDDPDVLMLYGVIENDTVSLKQALDAGANRRITFFEIVQKYQSEYDEFVTTFNDGN